LTTIDINTQRSAVRQLAESLDIPPSAYKLAVERYDAMSRHLERDESAIAKYRPYIYPQGSFQLGTVVPPHDPKHGYDLDLACEMRELTKTEMTQEKLKQLVGDEAKAYASKYGMHEPTEKPRCWHLDYQDPKAHFHMDIVPSVPEDEATKRRLATLVLPANVHFVESAVGITDKNNANYRVISSDWRRSNPRGYAAWFKSRMRTVAVRLMEARADVRKADEVPAYEWKTPLQVAVQIIKQHRNAMFRDELDNAPPSCIITTLAGLAYEGQLDERDALMAIVQGMPKFIRSAVPFVANPVNPEEDFADKWTTKPGRRKHYDRWYAHLVRDLDQLGAPMTADQITEEFGQKFGVSLPGDKAKKLATKLSVPASVAAPSLRIASKPPPWAARG